MPANRVSDDTSLWSSGRPNSVADGDVAADDLLPDGVDEGAVAGPEDRVAEERFGFGPVADGVVGGGRAGAEAGDLREDEPHPVRASCGRGGSR